eukprot:UC1_evm1s2101
MLEEDIEHPVKVLIVGNGAVGKSSMIQRYCKGVYTSDYKKTIGVDFLEKSITVDNEDLRMMIWDTAGQDEFDSLTKAYYRDAEACVLAFSTTDRDSFEAIEKWIKKVEAEVGKIPMVLIQNKIDLIDQAVMTKQETEALADRIQLKFYRTSVQENYNVNEVFKYLAGQYVKKLRSEESAARLRQRAHVGASGSASVETPKREFTGAAARGQQQAPGGGFKLTKPKERTGGKKRSKLDFCSLI